MQLTQPIAFVGLPGCGKGTQGRLLQENLGVMHIDGGATLRKILSEDSSSKDLKEILRRAQTKHGKNDTGLVKETVQIILEYNNVEEKAKNLCLDSFARNRVSLEVLNEIFGEVLLVNFIISGKLSHKRMVQRNIRASDRSYRYRKGRIGAFVVNTLPLIERLDSEGRVIKIYSHKKGIEDVHEYLVNKLQKNNLLV